MTRSPRHHCRFCDGSGVVDCRHCRGHACGVCYATGEEVCEVCRGLGSVPSPLLPHVCSGRVVEGRREPCGVVLSGPDPDVLPPGHPVSHGLCGDCLVSVTEELERLKRARREGAA